LNVVRFGRLSTGEKKYLGSQPDEPIEMVKTLKSDLESMAENEMADEVQ
jgi:hypothetical protein